MTTPKITQADRDKIAKDCKTLPLINALNVFADFCQRVVDEQEFDPEMIPCPDCENGEVSLTYADVQGSGLGMSIERAANMAGAHHHWETCERCGGKGEIEAEEGDNNDPDRT